MNAHDLQTQPVRPFLKWAGGKRQLLPSLLPLVPKSIKSYREPFVGGGSLFFKLLPSVATLSDINSELIEAYIAIRDDVEAVIEALKTHVYDKHHFYQVRGQDIAELSISARAARFIFLNRTGFNGLYRVNKKGIFNVPFGRYTNPKFCDPPNLRMVSRALRGVTILNCSFEEALTTASAKDFIYLDPPYIPVSRTSSFVDYQKNGFGMDHQEQLATVYERLAQRGCFVMLSNSSVPWVHERFRDFRICTVSARRCINARPQRKNVNEVIITNY